MIAAIYILGIAALLRVVYTTWYRLFLSPLAKIPGPRISAVTRVYLMYKEFTASRRLYVNDLHNIYGPVVRIAPDEVSFATADAAKQIYTVGGSGWDKSDFYDQFTNFGARNMFSTPTKTEHTEIRKRVADMYTKTNVTRPDVIDGITLHARAFVAKCSQLSAMGKSVDVYINLHCFGLDAMTHYLFFPYGTRSLEGGEDMEKAHELCYHDSLKERVIQSYFPRAFKVLERSLSSFRSSGGPRSGLALNYVLDTVSKPGVADFTVLAKFQSLQDKIPQMEVASESMDHVVAGIETTGDALCFLIWQLSLPEATAIQERLHAEIVNNPGVNVDDLPYVEAVVMEGLRLYGPAPMSFPRVVPEGGKVMEGYFVPGGTVVGCQPFTLHRYNSETFPRSSEFIPERWLEEKGRVERNRLFFAFSNGGRGCVGKHFALMEMKILLKEVYSGFKTTIAPDMNACMEISDQIIVSRPKDQKCLIAFEEIQ